LDRLSALHPKLIDLKLDRVLRLLQRLGDPHLSLPNVIHVAGTNGKGSTVAFIRAGLEAAGLRVNTHTSPHLVNYTERVRLADGPIAEPHLLEVLKRCEQANGDDPITLFEITTVAALLAFAESPADATLVEVGLGGRFDATNVFPAPAVTAITPVSLDHVDFLGRDVEKIAWEKAGILKSGRPGIIAAQSQDAMRSIQDVATEVGAPLHTYGDDWRVERHAAGFRFIDGANTFDLPLPALAGNWQIGNAGTALAVLNRLEGFDLTPGIAAAAMRNVSWPGRLQPLKFGPFVELLKPRALWLDGGHNAAAAIALADTLAEWPEPPHIIVGMLATKDNTAFFRALGRITDQVEIIKGPGVAALDVDSLAAFARSSGLKATPHNSLSAAVKAVAAEGGTAPVLIAGSLYLAGEVLAAHS
jgi:dihydrofolate synthase/folylpolyglutamate synthase